MSRKINVSVMSEAVNEYMSNVYDLNRLNDIMNEKLKPLNAKLEAIDVKRNDAVKAEVVKTYRAAAEMFPNEDILKEVDAVKAEYMPQIKECRRILKEYRNSLPDSLYVSYFERIKAFKDVSGKHNTGRRNGEIIVYKGFTAELRDWLKTYHVSYLDNDNAISKFAAAIVTVLGGRLKRDGYSLTITANSKDVFVKSLFTAIAVYGDKRKSWTYDGKNIYMSDAEAAAKAAFDAEAAANKDAAEKAAAKAAAEAEKARIEAVKAENVLKVEAAKAEKAAKAEAAAKAEKAAAEKLKANQAAAKAAIAEAEKAEKAEKAAKAANKPITAAKAAKAKKAAKAEAEKLTTK